MQVLKDSTDTLLVYPPSSHSGQASSASVRVGTPSTPIPDDDSWEAATVDAVSATTNAAANKGATSLSFASDPTCTPGRKYLLELTTGQKLHVEVIATGTTVVLAEPLAMAIPSGTALKGVAITHALTTAETENLGEGLVKVKATIGGSDFHWDQRFEVVDSIFSITLTAAALSERRPDIMRLRPPNDLTGSELIEAAWTDVLRLRLRARGYEEAKINSPVELEPALLEACAYLVTKMYRSEDTERMQARMDDLERAIDDTLASKQWWYDESDQDVMGERETLTEHQWVGITR